MGITERAKVKFDEKEKETANMDELLENPLS